MRTIIVDDEIAAINSLSWELRKYPDLIDIIDTFTSPREAIHGIHYLKPDCVFLDIEMPEMSGFSLLDRLEYRDFAVVITTAYNQYALKAIKESAIDYLLKPVDGDDIASVMEKLEKMDGTHHFRLQFEETFEALSNVSTPKVVKIPASGKILFLRVDEIVYCESDGNYSKVFLESGEEIMVSKKLKDLEDLLPAKLFFRIHNSYIVHLMKVNEYLRSEGYLVLSNQIKIPISRNKKDAFLERMSQ